MSKFTPEPWELSPMLPYGIDIHGDGVWIASIHNSHRNAKGRAVSGFPSDEECMANARFFKTAPKMYAALKNAVEMLRAAKCTAAILNPLEDVLIEAAEE